MDWQNNRSTYAQNIEREVWGDEDKPANLLEAIVIIGLLVVVMLAVVFILLA